MTRFFDRFYVHQRRHCSLSLPQPDPQSRDYTSNYINCVIYNEQHRPFCVLIRRDCRSSFFRASKTTSAMTRFFDHFSSLSAISLPALFVISTLGEISSFCRLPKNPQIAPAFYLNSSIIKHE